MTMLFHGLPSISTIILSVFIGYLAYSLWSVAQLFIPPSCTKATNCIKPIIEENPKLQLLAYSSVKKIPRYNSDVTLIHKENPINYDSLWEKNIQVEIPSKVRANGSLYLHIFLTSTKVKFQWESVLNDPLSMYASVPLTQYHVPEAKSFNLLGESENQKNKVKSSSTRSLPVSHFYSQISLNILTQPVNLPSDEIPYEIGRSLRLSRGKYLPILHVDVMSLRSENLVEITSDTKVANLTLKYSPITFGKLRMWIQFEGAMESMMQLGFTHKDIDEVKGIFSDSNLYLLCITFIVATLHLLFDFLAFKNDISFWRGLESMGGISSTTVIWRTFAQIVIFFYLLEENTSLLVLVPAGIGALIEIWKVTKAFHLEFEGWKPKLQKALTKEESNTQELDSEGLRYLSYVMYPLCIGGAIYSLLYIPHKSWYSWIINSLVNGIYAFGFLFMMPQLFINYKLKSVAHLPWKAFMYKAFNTFIDDLFAFIITMPTAHRVACFRDDIVFLIYLYQRWLYPVDKSRVNEFGHSGEEKKKKKKKKE